MKPTEHAPKTPSPRTGIFALLSNMLRVKGTGAPLVLVLALGALVLTPSLASANGGYVETTTPIALGPGEEAGQLDLAVPSHQEHGSSGGGPKQNIGGSGVAVDGAGDVYVADTNNHRISEFESDGAFVRTFGKDVNKNALALEPNVCSALEECQKGAEGTSPGELQAPRFIAVDNSTGPSKGDVYVGDGVGTQAVNELQFVEITPGAIGGTYTLTVDGETTNPIAYTDVIDNEKNGPDAQAAQRALEELAKVGHGDVKVNEEQIEGGGAVAGLLVEFVGALAEAAEPTLGCNAADLTPPGASCAVKVERVGSKLAGEVISKFSPEGKLEESWGVKGKLDGSTAEKGPFEGKLEGIAVDPSGNLWVMDEGDVFEFEQDGKQTGETHHFLHEIEFGRSASGIAVNGEDDLYAINSNGAVQEYSPTLQPLGALSSGHAVDPTGFALDQATAQVFVGLGESLEKGDSECASHGDCEVFGSTELRGGAGVAVDPASGAAYAASTVPDQLDVFALLLTAETSPASEVKATSLTVNGTVNPEGSPLENCYFEYGPTTNYGQTAECEPGAAGIGSGTQSAPVHAELKGLQGGTVYHFRVVAVKREKAIAGNDVAAPATLALPVIADAEVPLTELTGGSAQLTATVDPEGVAVESCVFEYGTSTSYGLAVPCRPDVQHIGASLEPVPVRAALEELQPNTTYHWRLSVSDANGEVQTPDHVFVYPTTGSGALPDGRQYEMVSPVQKNGAAFNSLYAIHYAIGEDGSQVMLTSIQCYGASQSCTASRDNEGEPVAFARTAAGWVPTFISPPASMFSANSYWLLAPDAGTALFSMPSAPGGQDNWYLRQQSGSFLNVGPLTPPADGSTNYELTGSVAIAAGFSHVVWQDGRDIGEDEFSNTKQWTALGISDTQADTPQVYEYTGAGNTQPLLVGVNNEGRPLGCPVVLGDEVQPRAVSADGRTVYFTAGGGCGDQLEARIDDGEAASHTVTLDSSACVEGEPGAAECRAVAGEHRVANFEGASADGTRAVFLDTQKLTDEATQGTGNADGPGSAACAPGGDCNLYLSECTAHCAGSGEQESNEQRALIDVSAGDRGGFGPGVLGVVGISADGSHVYFLANGVLTPGAAPGSCHTGAGSERELAALRCNLYVYERDERYPNGHVALVASVPGDVTSKLLLEPTKGVNVTPDGQFLVFESEGDLTPDDTRSDGYTQVFRYDAESEQLIRVSIGAGGYNDDGNAGVGDARIASQGEEALSVAPYRGDLTMSDDGSRVFFQSPIALAPHALNDAPIGVSPYAPYGPVYAQNVYEWESEGAGRCPIGQAAGCTYLISDGRDVSNAKSPCNEQGASCLLGTDATGNNVFLATADQLVPEDTDTAVDVYDAQVCEPENPCAPHAPAEPEPCQNEQCHGIPAATPSLLAPGTASFNGEGNITPPPPAVKKVTKKTVKCRKGFVKNKKHKCVRSKKRAKKSSKSKRGGKS